MKKLFYPFLLSIILLPTVGCSSNEESYVIGDSGTLLSGYTSLENKNQNPAISNNDYSIGDITFKVKDVLHSTYNKEIDHNKMNYLLDVWGHNSTHYENLIDGLVEFDKYGNIVGALALGYKMNNNDDNTVTFSFQLRENAEWVDNTTHQKVDKVKAEDFVTSARYILENKSPKAGYITEFIKGAKEYYDGETYDFDDVGIKAKDDYVIEYTLKEKCPYFLQILNNSAFLPVNASYLGEQGDNFGSDFNHILINGPFLVASSSTNNNITYSKNYHYYDRDHVYVKRVVRHYVAPNDLSYNPLTLFNKNELDYFVFDKDDEDYHTYVGEKPSNPSNVNCLPIKKYGENTYYAHFNYWRDFYNYESYSGASHITTEADRRATMAAMLNANFRKGFMYSLDFESYIKRFSSSIAEPEQTLFRGYTSKNVGIANNKDYVTYLEDIYNERNDTSIYLEGIDQGKDPIFNLEKASYYFALAKEELEEQGFTGPIYIDFILAANSSNNRYERELFAQINEASNDFVMVNLLKSNNDPNSWTGLHVDSDFTLFDGWGPDYNDPTTFLDQFDYDGNSLEHLGIAPQGSRYNTGALNQYMPNKYLDLVDDKDTSLAYEALRKDLLGDYHEYLQDARLIDNPNDMEDRFTALAEAEYQLIFEDALIIPWYSGSQYNPTVTREIPCTRYSNSSSYKNVIVSNSTVTQEQYQSIYSEYIAR